MQKQRANKNLALLAGLLALALIALIEGSSAASAANQGSSQGVTLQKTSTAQSGCARKVPGCQGNASSSDTKSAARRGDTPSLGGRITSISETTIIVQSKNLVSTIHLTSATTFVKFSPLNKASQPASQSAIKVGQVIQAEGTLQSDGSLTAAVVIIEQ
jgi:hypothetical protein